MASGTTHTFATAKLIDLGSQTPSKLVNHIRPSSTERNVTGKLIPSSSLSNADIKIKSLPPAKRDAFYRNEHSFQSSLSNGPSSLPPSIPANPSSISLSSTYSVSSSYTPLKESTGSKPESIKSKDSADQSCSNDSSRKLKQTSGYVGFANLPNQIYRKAVKKGFEFTMMVVGESGLGKSTFINSLFLAEIYPQEDLGTLHKIKQTVEIEVKKVLLEENGIKLTLTIVDTPGFGDAINNADCWKAIINYIENQYEEYLNNECRVNRKQESDGRVHCCLYFIAPTGHGLKPLDVAFMKNLHDKVNIIPLIAKADTMTPSECSSFKKQILAEMQKHEICTYKFPSSLNEDDAKLQQVLKDKIPFAVVGSNTIIDVNGKKVRARQYPWGTVEGNWE